MQIYQYYLNYFGLYMQANIYFSKTTIETLEKGMKYLQR